MVRERLYNLKNEKQRANRISRVQKSENRTYYYCNIYNIFIECNANSRLALSAHVSFSRKAA